MLNNQITGYGSDFFMDGSVVLEKSVNCLSEELCLFINSDRKKEFGYYEKKKIDEHINTNKEQTYW